jgi:hypothetical protein
MTRHLLSLGLMRRDKGWINTLLAEAENERMHLLTFLKLKQPGPVFRGAVLTAQAVFWPMCVARCCRFMSLFCCSIPTCVLCLATRILSFVFVSFVSPPTPPQLFFCLPRLPEPRAPVGRLP